MNGSVDEPARRLAEALSRIEDRERMFLLGMSRCTALRGHPKPAIQGHLQSGHTERMDCGRKLGCGKTGCWAALEIALRFPRSHNPNSNITS